MTGPVGAAPPPDGFGLPGGQPAGARWGSPAPPPVYLRVAFHNVTSILTGFLVKREEPIALPSIAPATDGNQIKAET
ncbi:MAG: hypothetical protein A3G57_01020 [Candidatus Andersenbacteria bacterium RIFCSPLOWO2_12_FULL_45_8]|nr:MAG: hypothetical protein A3G57_01020 [Candidatus Andersenbacteria bacterium RIFCSPLOWO2_12_FULL_45_8]